MGCEARAVTRKGGPADSTFVTSRTGFKAKACGRGARWRACRPPRFAKRRRVGTGEGLRGIALAHAAAHTCPKKGADLPAQLLLPGS